jgi:saccharopine dehydrogenase-like NADP-dependent oxidoreductase
MSTILILGSAGYVALPLAQSLLRSGNHTVIGLVRREEQATLLLQNEIQPIVADAGDIAAWTKVIEDEHIDVVVDCSSGYEHAGKILEGVVAAAKKRQQELAKDGFGQVAKMGFLYVWS